MTAPCPLAPGACLGLGCPYNGLRADPLAHVDCPVIARLTQDATPDRFAEDRGQKAEDRGRKVERGRDG